MSSKRGNGEGSVFKKGNKWIAKIGYKEGGKTKRAQVSANSKAHAMILLQELINKHRKQVKRSRTTLGEYLDGWLSRTVKVERSPATYANYHTTVETHIKPHLGDLYLENLTASKIADWLNALDASGAGKRTRQNAYAILNAALGLAVKWSETEVNPCALVGRPKYERDPIHPFTIPEVRSILGATENTRLGALYQLALRLGLRQGEIFGLEWDDFDKTAMTISVVRQAVEVSGTIHIKPPKTKSGVRVIPLDQDCVDALIQRKAFALTEGFVNLKTIFPNRKGEVMHRSNFGHRHWRPLLKKLSIEHRGFHHARHTAATMMLSMGIDVTTVSRILGHKRPSITLDLYSHYVPNNGTKAVQAMSKAIRG